MSDRVLVAGGGIGGLAAAVGLARAGLDVTVLERASELRAVGSGLLLHPNGTAALDLLDAGLGRRVRAAGHVTAPGEHRLILDAAGRVLSREPIGASAARHGRPMVPILRSALQELLLDAARSAGARVRLGTGVRSLAPASPHRAGVLLTDGTRLDADLVVAADGIRSVLRAAVLGDGPPSYRGYTSVRGRTRGAGAPPQAFVVNGRGLQLFVAPVGGGDHYWTAKVTAPADTWPRLGPDGARTALLDAMAGWTPEVRELIAGTDAADLTVSDIQDRDPVRRWAHGRVVLLGDAAHPMVPALGQGANTAIEDALVLTRSVLDHPADLPAALRAYERSRGPRTARVVRLSRRQGALDQGTGRLRALVRDVGTRLRGRKDAASLAPLALDPVTSVPTTPTPSGAPA